MDQNKCLLYLLVLILKRQKKSNKAKSFIGVIKLKILLFLLEIVFKNFEQIQKSEYINTIIIVAIISYY